MSKLVLSFLDRILGFGRLLEARREGVLDNE